MGTILPYVGDLDKIPKKWHLCDGSDGTPNLLDGKFLEGSTVANTIITPGLPNITAKWSSYEGGGYHNYKNTGIGAVYCTGEAWFEGSFYNQDYAPVWAFDASRVSSIYRNDINTVQPYSYTVYFIMKIKI